MSGIQVKSKSISRTWGMSMMKNSEYKEKWNIREREREWELKWNFSAQKCFLYGVLTIYLKYGDVEDIWKLCVNNKDLKVFRKNFCLQHTVENARFSEMSFLTGSHWRYRTKHCIPNLHIQICFHHYQNRKVPSYLLQNEKCTHIFKYIQYTSGYSDYRVKKKKTEILLQ